jgi:hypothetical protein
LKIPIVIFFFTQFRSTTGHFFGAGNALSEINLPGELATLAWQWVDVFDLA